MPPLDPPMTEHISLAAPSSPCVSSANHVQLARTVGLDRRAPPCYNRDMTIKRLDHISVVVDDLEAAIAFFTALGMTVEGKAPIEGPWVDRINGLEGVKVDI